MNWLFFGFLAAWLVHLGYLLSLSIRQRKISRELENLRRMMSARERGGP